MPLPFFKQDDKRKIPADVIREICDWLRYDVQSSEDGSKSWKLKKERVATLRACRLVSRAWCQGASFAFSDSTTISFVDVHEIPRTVLTHRGFLSKVRHVCFGSSRRTCKPLCMVEIIALLESLESLQTLRIHLQCRCEVAIEAITSRAATVQEVTFSLGFEVDEIGTNMGLMLHLFPSLRTLSIFEDADVVHLSLPFKAANPVLPHPKVFHQGRVVCGSMTNDKLLQIVSIDTFQHVEEMSLDGPGLLHAKSGTRVLEDVLALNLKKLTIYDPIDLVNYDDFKPFKLSMVRNFRQLEYLDVSSVLYLRQVLKHAASLPASVVKLCVSCTPRQIHSLPGDVRAALKHKSLKKLRVRKWHIREWLVQDWDHEDLSAFDEFARELLEIDVHAVLDAIEP